VIEFYVLQHLLLSFKQGVEGGNIESNAFIDIFVIFNLTGTSITNYSLLLFIIVILESMHTELIYALVSPFGGVVQFKFFINKL
jgi:hypothetical protein